jgi:NADH:ubiquinone oxidoreductase subunit H
MDPVLIAQVALVLVVFHALLLSAAAMVWAERKVAARLQQRFGKPAQAGNNQREGGQNIFEK